MKREQQNNIDKSDTANSRYITRLDMCVWGDLSRAKRRDGGDRLDRVSLTGLGTKDSYPPLSLVSDRHFSAQTPHLFASLLACGPVDGSAPLDSDYERTRKRSGYSLFIEVRLGRIPCGGKTRNFVNRLKRSPSRMI